MAGGYDLLFQVYRENDTVTELNSSEECADRADDVPRLDRARWDFRKHRGKKEDIFVADEHNLDFGMPRELSFQGQGCVDSSETAA